MKIKRWLVRAIDVIAECIPQRLISSPRNDENAVLSPLLYILLGLKRKSKTPPLCERSPEEGRAQYRADVLPLNARYEVKDTSDFSIPFDDRQLPLRHYVPDAINSVPALLIYFHGGGYVIGDLDTHDDICRLICKHAGVQVLSVDYRLAPEYPYPACIEDADFVVKWVQTNADRFSINSDAVIVGGDSAGATIAAATANNFLATNHQVLAQLLIYPGTDRSSDWGSYAKFGYDYFLNSLDRDWFYSHYTDNCVRLAEDTNVSPLKYDFVTQPTPTIIATAGFDALRDEGRSYADTLKSAGAKLDHLHFGELTHGFVNLVAVHRQSEKASIEIAVALRALIPRSKG